MIRYADGPTIEVEVLIQATPAAVWAVIADPQPPVATSEELLEAVWIDHPSREPGLGSTIHGRNQHAARHWCGHEMAINCIA